VALAVTASLASAQGDMTVHRMGYSGTNGNAMTYYGQSGGIAAYSIASQSCNIGNVNLPWTSGSGQQHPVISQNVYRLKGHRFEHLGQSWLKHGFCALCESGCGSGTGGGCANELRVGCADTYSSGLNDGQNGGPKYAVNPTVGDHNHSTPSPTGNATIRGRLQVAVNDVDPALNAGARYFIEGNYVHWKDHQNGFAHNNSTWRTCNFTSGLTMQGDGNSVNHVGEACVYGWKNEDSSVDIQEIVNTNEGGAGIHGFYQVASRVWDNLDGTWDYTYVVNNQNSTQGAYSFAVPYGGGANLSGWWFNDVDYHSGEPQDGTDWSHTEGGGAITWTCPQTYAQNINANAINWCTAYSFGFTADVAPSSGVGELTMFEPGVGSLLTFPVDGPGTGTGSNTGFSLCDGTLGNCPCGAITLAGHGCPNTNIFGLGAQITGSGNASVGTDTFNLVVSNGAFSKPGLILRGTVDLSPGINNIANSEGLLCVSGATVRGNVFLTDGAGDADPGGIFQGVSSFGAFANLGGSDYYQYWYRDPASTCNQNNTGGSNFNFTNAWCVSWLP
jgi:hypothetical protein